MPIPPVPANKQIFQIRKKEKRRNHLAAMKNQSISSQRKNKESHRESK